MTNNNRTAAKTKRRKMRPPLPRRRPAVQWFRQGVDPYHKDIFVCTGFSTMAQVKQHIGKCDRWFADWLEIKTEDFAKLAKDDHHAFVMTHPTRGAAIIRLRSYRNQWYFWETLLHEIHHYVEQLSEQCGFDDELEAKAYLQEHLFRSIRRQFQGLD